MSNEQNKTPGDALDRAAAALRDMAVPPGPPAEVLCRTLARLETAKCPSRSSALNWRIFPSAAVTRLAMAAGLAIALGGLVFWILTQSHTGVAFADVLKNVRSVQSVRFTVTTAMKVPGRPEQKVTADTLIVEPARMRQTIQSMGMVTIADFRQGKWLTLDPKSRQAVVMEMSNMPPQQTSSNLLEHFRQLHDNDAIPLGEREVAGSLAKGFKLNKPGMEMNVWANAESRLPVLVEMTLHMGALPQQSMTMTDFAWNLPVDESLLSLTPPEGYELRNLKMDAAPPTEKDLIDALKTTAELNGGVFPEGLDVVSLGKIMQSMERSLPKDKNAPEWKAAQDRFLQAMPILGRGWMVLGNPEIGADWHYAGMGVKMGAADAPLLWYRPKNATMYHVIGADLTVREVGPENLPAIASKLISSPSLTPATQPAR